MPKDATVDPKHWAQRECALDAALRPPSLEEFVGQSSIKNRLSVVLQAARQRGEALGHCLFSGPPGLGKTTLAAILAKSMGVSCVITSGPVLERAGDLAGLLSSLNTGDILFIDEIHRLHRQVEEYLYPAMEDFKLDVMLDSGPGARSVQLPLNRFTLIGATTRQGLISSPLLSRFPLILRLDYYEEAEIESILMRSATLLNFELDREAAQDLAHRSRGTPRIANNLLRWLRDFAQVDPHQRRSRELVKEALEHLALDGEGLEEVERRLLKLLVSEFSGGPVGVQTLAAALGEDRQTIEEVYEPYLLRKGLLQRTPRGRCATKKTYEHLCLYDNHSVLDNL